MWSRFLCPLALSAVFIVICNAVPLNTNEAEARQFVQGVSEKMYTHYDRLSRDTFSLDEKKSSEEALATVNDIFKSAVSLVDIANQAVSYDISSFHDEELKRILIILRRVADEAIVAGKAYLFMMVALAIFEESTSHKNINAYHNETVQLALYPDIVDVFQKSSDPEELKHYWLAWREKSNQWAKENYQSIINIVKQAANYTGLPPAEYWLRDYNMSELTYAMTQLQPLYMQLHAFIREQLYKKYGSTVIEKDGLIPDHLYKQVLAQIWTGGSVIDDIFPFAELPPYDTNLAKQSYTPLKIYKMADKFYRSLGFEPIPDKIWGSQIYLKTVDDEGNCKPTIFDMSSNVYMQYCRKMDFVAFLEAHGYMAELYFATEKHDLPAYYFPSYELEHTVGKAVLLSASTPKHAKEVGLVDNFEFTDQVHLNRLVRMSMNTLLKVPAYYVHVKVMVDVLSGEVEIAKINKHYWKLMKTYVGVAPPVERPDNLFDFPYEFYVDINQYSQAVDFTSEILSYQVYKKLCQISEQYPSDPLYNCDFYGSKSVGNALKNMISLGSSKSYEEVLGSLLSEDPHLNAENLLEFYHPVKGWLTSRNNELNVHVGWPN